MYWKSKGIVVSCFILLVTSVCGQQKLTLESMVPPPPNAAELGKYGSYPVGMLTGLPDISFPLYEINTGKLKLPITLSYHASGIKVNQRSTDVGLGWSIMAGGTISRTIFSSPDDKGDSYFNDSYTPPTFQELQNIKDFSTLQMYTIPPGHDLEPDLFLYNFNGKSGKFIGKKDKSFLTIPFDPIKIQRSKDGQGKLIFQITDENGTIYQFNKYTSTNSDVVHNGWYFNRQDLSAWYLTSMISADNTDAIYFEYENNAVEEGIVSHSYPIGKKWTGLQIGFVSGPLETTNTSINHGELLLKKITFRNGSVQFNRNTIREDAYLQSRALDEIVVYNNNSQPVKKYTFNHDYFRANPDYGTWQHSRLKLTGFVESDFNNTKSRNYSFDYNATPLPPSGSYNIDYWGYYNGQNNLSLIPTTTVYAGDMGANFNDGLGYGIGMDASNSWVIGDANREPSADYMQAAVLNKIVYPTGGYSAFEFEPHKYLSEEYNSQVVTKGGNTPGTGPRNRSQNVYSFSYPTDLALININKVINADLVINFSWSNPAWAIDDDPQVVTMLDQTTNITTTWKHTGDPATAQTLNLKYLFTPGHSYVLTVTNYGDLSTFINCTLSWSELVNQHPVKIGGGLRVKSIKNYNSDGSLAKEEQYKYGVGENGLGTKLFDERNFYKNYEDVVLEHFKGSGTESNWCLGVADGTTLLRNYLGISNYSSLSYLGSPVLYPFVTKYEGSDVANIGKTTYAYDINLSQTYVPAEFINSGNYGAIDAAWNQGELREETVYKNDNNQYTPVTKAEYEYTKYNQVQEYAVQMKQYKQVVFVDGCVIADWNAITQNGRPGLAHFTMFQYPIPSGGSRKTKETKTVYAQQGIGNVQTITTTQYLNPGHLYPSVVNTTLSDGSQKTSKYFYPQDLSVSGNMYEKLSQKNMLNIPARTETYLNNQALESGQRFFSNSFSANTEQVLPSSYTKYDKANAAVQTINFLKYDQYGKSLERELDGNIVSNLYDYQSVYPVCEVKNAGQADIAYTSFEADGTGNWNISSSNRNPVGITGVNSYQLVNGSITKTGLTAGKTYIVSYWTTNGSAFTINGTQGVPLKGKSINGWTYFQHKVTGVTDVSIPQVTGVIDELRLYPETAQMTTYTYTPLVGVSSTCSVNNSITYYEYDALNRLLLIKDEDGHIIKAFDYKYQAQ